MPDKVNKKFAPDHPRRPTMPSPDGIGSSFATNHLVSGTADARTAQARASQALQSPAAQDSESDHRSFLIGEMVVAAYHEEYWEPPLGRKLDKEQFTAWANNQSIEKLEALHKECVEARDEAIERQAGLHDEVAISVFDDPFYNAMLDTSRRRSIEKDLDPLDLTQLLFLNSIKQDVQIHSNLRIKVGSLSSEHGLWIHRIVSSNKEVTTTREFESTINMYRVAAQVLAINGTDIGTDVMRHHGETNFKAFQDELEANALNIRKLPETLLEELSVQVAWFNIRVRKLVAGDLAGKVGNS